MKRLIILLLVVLIMCACSPAQPSDDSAFLEPYLTSIDDIDGRCFVFPDGYGVYDFELTSHRQYIFLCKSESSDQYLICIPEPVECDQ